MLTLGSTIDKLTSVHAFNGDEIFNSLLVSVCISEHNLGERGTSTSIMNDVLDHSLDVSMIINL